ncbi:hypothetical protein [Mesonia maritima]|uniref:Uncharacterized protein n=2 Tax=Mesonia maritima TaxID=1793873 RepID=A0ABU1K3W1_9FLAO|nr:hypothetical protein [Mesonia maritima]MDR6299697.1 hypothetical protein [Mesonia maritima]
MANNTLIATENLYDTNRQKHEVAVSHFQQTLFVEEFSVNFSWAENSSDAPINFHFTKPTQFYFAAEVFSAKIVEHYFLPDQRNLILQQLFPFHFFF